MGIKEVLVGFVGKVDSAAGAINTIMSNHNSGAERFELVNNLGQVVANVTAIVPFLAPIGIQTNVLAGTMTVLKITVDIKDGRAPAAGDVLALVGNIAGVVATVGVLASLAPEIAVYAGAVAVLSNVGGIAVTDGGLRDWVAKQLQDLWPPNTPSPGPVLNDYWIDTNGMPRRYEDIANDYNWGGPGFRLTKIDKSHWQDVRAETPPPPRPEDQVVDGDGQM